jgi:hypothetical protein
MFEEEEDRTEQDIKALGDSVAVIDEVLALETPGEEALDALDRNVRHIEIMLDKDHIKDSGEDLTEFVDAVARGREMLDD